MVAVLVSPWAGSGWAQALRVVGFDVESGGARPDVVDDLIAAAQDVDLRGFSEVQGEIWATLFEPAAEDGESGEFRLIWGTTSGGDRLLIVYNRERFEAVRQFELTDINIEGRARAPLVAHFRLKPAGPEWLFMVSHLYRGNAAGRHEQARLLNAWARQQTLPVIAVGDYNVYWDVRNGDTVHDHGYDLLTTDGVFTRVRPAQLIRAQYSFDSVLDNGVLAEPKGDSNEPPRLLVIDLAHGVGPGGGSHLRNRPSGAGHHRRRDGPSPHVRNRAGSV